MEINRECLPANINWFVQDGQFIQGLLLRLLSVIAGSSHSSEKGISSNQNIPDNTQKEQRYEHGNSMENTSASKRRDTTNS